MTAVIETEMVRRQAADLERALAELALLRSRLEYLEGRLGGSSAAHATLAGRVEDVGAQLGRVNRLEAVVDNARTAAAASADQHTAQIMAEVAGLRAATDKREQRTEQTLLQAGGRLERLEGQMTRMEVDARQEVLRSEMAQIAARLREVEVRCDEVVRRPPRPEPTTTARIEALAEELHSVRESVAPWQERIEDLAETARQAQIRAEGLLDQAKLLREEQNTVAQAGRLAEEARNQIMAEQAKAAEARWSTFLNERGHDWARVKTEGAARDRALAEVADRVAELTTRIARVAVDVTETGSGLDHDVRDLRESVLKGFAALKSAIDDAAAVVEGGVPYDQRSDVVGERQEALRRALRARRPDG